MLKLKDKKNESHYHTLVAPFIIDLQTQDWKSLDYRLCVKFQRGRKIKKTEGII